MTTRKPFQFSVESIETMAFERAMKEASYYLDEISTEVVSVQFQKFIVDVLARRLKYDANGWLTFDGKKLAHVGDTQP